MHYKIQTFKNVTSLLMIIHTINHIATFHPMSGSMFIIDTWPNMTLSLTNCFFHIDGFGPWFTQGYFSREMRMKGERGRG